MIDEKKLIDTLRPYYDKVLHQNISDDEKLAKHDMLSDVMVEIKEQPKIGGWIPCSERLPDNISTVILHVKEIEKPTFGWYEDMEKKWILSEKDFVDLDKFTVIAWQPLPEAYHG